MRSVGQLGKMETDLKLKFSGDTHQKKIRRKEFHTIVTTYYLHDLRNYRGSKWCYCEKSNVAG